LYHRGRTPDRPFVTESTISPGVFDQTSSVPARLDAGLSCDVVELNILGTAAAI
jgi:hypothetical protein